MVRYLSGRELTWNSALAMLSRVTRFPPKFVSNQDKYESFFWDLFLHSELQMSLAVFEGSENASLEILCWAGQ